MRIWRHHWDCYNRCYHCNEQLNKITMKKYIIFLLISVVFSSPTISQKEKEWTFIDYLDAGIKILEVANKAAELYNQINESDTRAVITFTTNDPSEVKVYVNSQLMGTINSRKVYSLKVSPGYYGCKAVFSDGSSFYEQVTAIRGSQYNVRLDPAVSNISYAVRKVYGFIYGDRVNFRSSSSTESKDNVISQASNNEILGILDKQIITQHGDCRITKRACYFTTTQYRSPYLVHGGVTMKVLRLLENGKCLVSFDTEEGIMTGYMETEDLTSIQSSVWYKVKMNGTIGWIYGDYVKMKHIGC